MAEERLRNERKAWRQAHPPGFVAKPTTKADGTNNLLVWDIKIPARDSSLWAPGLYAGTMTFTTEYPDRPPAVKFAPVDCKVLFHPNVYADGGVCLDIINPPESSHGYGQGGTWKPAITIKQVMLALQMFLDEPNITSPAQQEAYKIYTTNPTEYKRRVRLQAERVERAASHS